MKLTKRLKDDGATEYNIVHTFAVDGEDRYLEAWVYQYDEAERQEVAHGIRSVRAHFREMAWREQNNISTLMDGLINDLGKRLNA